MSILLIWFLAGGFFIERASATSLSDTPEWKALLHYFESSSSEINSDSPFFLSPEGASNPEAELTRTVQILGDPNAAPIGPLKMHPYCALPARRRFLEKNGYTFPKRECPEFKEFFDSLAPQSLSLVFSTHYAGNPASLFGHTLIRINRAEGSRLRDYAVNFAASVPPGEIGLRYVPFGLLGLYPGYFEISPYYIKVLEYNEAESRDLWEYELGYTREETRDWLEHLWEVRWLAAFRYTFLMRNCSYQVNRSLQVIRPRDGSLIPSWTFYTLPGESIRVVKQRHPELIRDIQFRPSHRRILRHQLAELSTSERSELANLLKDPVNRAAQVTNPKVLEAALQSSEYRKIEKQESDNTEIQATLRALRLARAKLPPGQSFSPTVAPADPTNQPDLAHSTRMISAGFIQGSGFAQEWSLRGRVGIHDRLERDQGNHPSFSLTGGDFEISRRDEENPRFRLRRFEIVKLESWEAFQTGDRPLSWGIFAGGVPFDEPRSALSGSTYFKTKAEVGFTVPVLKSLLTTTALAGLEGNFDSAIPGNRTASLPVSLWMNFRIRPEFKLAAFAVLRTPQSFHAPEFQYGMDASIFTSSETAFRVSAKKIERSFVYQTEGSLAEIRWGVFF